MRYNSKVNYSLFFFLEYLTSKMLSKWFSTYRCRAPPNKRVAICDCHNGGDTLVTMAEALVL